MFGDYGEKIREWRKRDELTLKKAAEIIGVDYNTLSRWEKGIEWPDRVKYEKLMKDMNKKDL